MTFDVEVHWRQLRQKNLDSIAKEKHRRQQQLQSSDATVAASGDNEIPRHGIDNSDVRPTVTHILQSLKEKKTRLGKRQEWLKNDVIDCEDLLQVGNALLPVFEAGPERCRIESGKILRTICQVNDGVIAKDLLSSLLPLLQQRMAYDDSSKKRAERSEEVRWMTVELLRIVVMTVQKDIDKHVETVFAIVSSGCSDPYGHVAITSCLVIQYLCKIFGVSMFRVAKEFVAIVAPLMLHRHRHRRVCAIETIGLLVQCGAHEMILELIAFQNPNIQAVEDLYSPAPKQNFFGILATDSCHNVRLAFLEMIGEWLLHLPERQEYVSKLIPFVLSALVDSTSRIATRGEIQEKELYLPKDAHEGEIANFWRTTNSVGLTTLYAPFLNQPRIGVRLIVQSHFASFVGAICADLTSSDAAIVIRSLNLLRVCILLIEDKVTEHLEEIFKALLKILMLWTTNGQETAFIIMKQSLRHNALLLKSFANKEILELMMDMHQTETDASFRNTAAMELKQMIINAAGQE